MSDGVFFSTQEFWRRGGQVPGRDGKERGRRGRRRSGGGVRAAMDEAMTPTQPEMTHIKKTSVIATATTPRRETAPRDLAARVQSPVSEVHFTPGRFGPVSVKGQRSVCCTANKAGGWFLETSQQPVLMGLNPI